MLFTARSPALSSLQPSAGVTSIARNRGMPAHLPWFVVTLIRTEDASSRWETACAAREEDLLEHLKRAGDIQIAELLYMAPPLGSGRMWARHHVYRIEKGYSEDSEFSIYINGGGHEICFANPDLDFELVKKRKVIFRVQHWRHFD